MTKNMEKSIIINRVSELQTKEDLLSLLNDIVKDELGREDAFSFSLKQLTYYCNPNNVRGRYRHFTIPKKNGEPRKIAAPSRGLGNILYYVNIMLKAIYQPSEYAMGFVEGRCVVDNASRHIGQNYVFNTDLKDFFPSIEQPRICARLQLPPFNFKYPIAKVLAGLCCIKETKEDGSFVYNLPQGAPTSPLITNAICDRLDRRLSGLARRFNLHYSRYADDITFSSMHNVYQDGSVFRNELERIIEDQHFKMNDTKTRLQKTGQRKEVTGLIVGSKVNTSSSYVAEIRNILHIWEKYGYNDAFQRFYPNYKAKKGHVKKGEPLLENVLYGKLQYLKMVKGAKDPVYAALQARYNKLTSTVNPEIEQKFDYLRSFTIAEFEEIVGGQITYALSQDGNLYGKVNLGGKEIIISITDVAKDLLVKMKIITDDNLIASIKHVKNTIHINSKPGLYVVLTSKNGKAPFWLMTYCDPTVTEIDLCNVPVSELIAIWEKDGIDAAIDAYKNGDGSDKIIKHVKDKAKGTKRENKDIQILIDLMDDVDLGITDDVLEAITEEVESGNFFSQEVVNIDDTDTDNNNVTNKDKSDERKNPSKLGDNEEVNNWDDL